MRFRLVGVQPEFAEAVWPDAMAWLAPSIELSDGLLSPESLLDGVQNSALQLWIGVDENDMPAGAAITEVRSLPSGVQTVHSPVVGARQLEVVLDCVPTLAEWGREIGASKLTMDGRLGWQCALPGWRKVSVMMEKNIAGR